MKNQKRFFFGQNRKPIARAYEVAIGECTDPIIGLDWNTVYMVDNGIGYVPADTDQLFVDVFLTIPFNGANAKHRLGVLKGGGGGAILVFNFDVNITPTGIISNLTECLVQGGDSGEVIGETHTSCISCMTITVSVPSGSKQVTIVKSGTAPYSGGIFCTAGTIVNADVDENISEDKTYSFGIDAASGSENSTTTITLQVDAETPIVLSRDHEDPVVNC